MLLQGIGRNDRDLSILPSSRSWTDFSADLAGSRPKIVRSLRSGNQPPARSEGFSAAILRIHGAPDRRQSEAGRGYGTRAMIFSEGKDTTDDAWNSSIQCRCGTSPFQVLFHG